MQALDRLIVALDVPTIPAASALVERLGDADRDVALAGEIGNQFWQIALQVNAEREKVRQHENLLGAGCRETTNGISEIRRGFEKCGLIQLPRAFQRRPAATASRAADETPSRNASQARVRRTFCV